jgi:hypothetical protein
MTTTIKYFRICIQNTKTKTILYEDDELDERGVVEVEVPLRVPLLIVEIKIETDECLAIGAPYIDNNQHPYYAIDSHTICGANIKTKVYELPKQFIKVGTPLKEGS